MPFLCTGIVLTLCTTLYALFGMLLRGGKTCKISRFSTVFSFNSCLLLLVTKMFITFTYLFVLFVVDADLRSVWGLLPGFSSHWTVRDFRECFGKLLYGCNLLLMIQNCSSFHGTSDSPPMKGYNHQGTANIQKILEVRVCCCVDVCMWGNVHSLRVRG